MKAAADHGAGLRWGSALRCTAGLNRIAAILQDRPDCEHELALYRLALGGLVGCYLSIAGSIGQHGAPDLPQSIVRLAAGFELAALGIFCHLLWRPGVCAARRVAGILIDVGALSYCLHVGGEAAAPLYPLYSLVILANGFRFGRAYLLAAADTAVASFALMAVATEFFTMQPGLSLALLGGLIVPALQMCTLMRGLRRTRHSIDAPTPTGGAKAPSVANPSEQAIAAATTPAGHEAAPQTLPELRSGEQSPPRLVILVADDNVTNQKVIAKILENAGHEARIVDNGQAAAEAVAKRAFDAVLMDVEMPRLNGLEAAKLIRFLSTGRPRVPIVGLVSQPDAATQRRCRDAGMDACIAKPIEPCELLQALETATAPGPARLPPTPEAAEPADPAGLAEGTPSPLEVRTLEALKALGGDDFVEDLARQFIGDAAGVLEELSQAVAKGDAQGFREHAHALRSGAANIGAQGVYEMCLGWRRIDPATLATQGKTYVDELEKEFGRVQAALQDYREYRLARKRAPAPSGANLTLGAHV